VCVSLLSLSALIREAVKKGIKLALRETKQKEDLHFKENKTSAKWKLFSKQTKTNEIHSF
jgi:hypothetical protein